MDYKKIQSQALKSIGTFRQWYINDGEDESQLINGNGIIMYVVPNKELVINSQMFGNVKTGINADEFEDLKLSRNAIYDPACNRLFLTFENESGEKIHIDKKNLELFDLKESTFKGKTKRNLLGVYEYDRLVGVVMGIILREDQEVQDD